MADIFISYSRKDRSSAERLAKALEEQGWSVWWDPQIPASKTFDEVIEQAIDAAKSVLVLWSKHSVDSSWVRTEANEGAERGILIPVLIEDVRPPLAFRRIQAANLIEWDGMTSHWAMQKLVSDITHILGLPPAVVAEEQRKAAERMIGRPLLCLHSRPAFVCPYTADVRVWNTNAACRVEQAQRFHKYPTHERNGGTAALVPPYIKNRA